MRVFHVSVVDRIVEPNPWLSPGFLHEFSKAGIGVMIRGSHTVNYSDPGG